MNKGWECPKCGKVYAPYVPKCDDCGNKTLHNFNPNRCKSCGRIIPNGIQ